MQAMSSTPVPSRAARSQTDLLMNTDHDTASARAFGAARSIRDTNISMAFTLQGSRTGTALVLQVTGRVDGETAPQLERGFRQWIADADRNLILDLSGLDYISSAGLSTVLGAGKTIDRQGGRLLISGLSDRLKRIFVFSGLDSLFPMFATTEAALASCTASQR